MELQHEEAKTISRSNLMEDLTTATSCNLREWCENIKNFDGVDSGFEDAAASAKAKTCPAISDLLPSSHAHATPRKHQQLSPTPPPNFQNGRHRSSRDFLLTSRAPITTHSLLRRQVPTPLPTSCNPETNLARF